MNFPKELRYTKEHEWIRIEGDHAIIGITDFAQRELGDIVYIDITTIGKKIEANAVFGTVEAVKTVSDLFLPITGVVEIFNQDLEKHPEWVNNDPYQKGWIARLSNIQVKDIDMLLTADQYHQLVGD